MWDFDKVVPDFMAEHEIYHRRKVVKLMSTTNFSYVLVEEEFTYSESSWPYGARGYFLIAIDTRPYLAEMSVIWKVDDFAGHTLDVSVETLNGKDVVEVRSQTTGFVGKAGSGRHTYEEATEKFEVSESIRWEKGLLRNAHASLHFGQGGLPSSNFNTIAEDEFRSWLKKRGIATKNL